MKRLALLLLLAGCGQSDEREPASNRVRPHVAAAPPASPPEADPASLAESRAAAVALRRYYELIGARRYREAWRMRADEPDRPRVGYEAFVAGYAPYADYHATIGTASPAMSGGGKLWVEVQVQRWGRMRDGTPFGDVGIVTLRRPLGVGSGARRWEIVG